MNYFYVEGAVSKGLNLWLQYLFPESHSETNLQCNCVKELQSTSWVAGKIKGNISQHCVAGQNAIRDKDAAHNWV